MPHSSAVLLVDGQMRGVWKYERKGSRLNVEIEPFAQLPPWVREGAEAEADELARFVGGKLDVSWASIQDAQTGLNVQPPPSRT